MNSIQRNYLAQGKLPLNPRNLFVFFGCFGVIFLLVFVYIMDDSTSYGTLELPTYSKKIFVNQNAMKGKLKKVFKTAVQKSVFKINFTDDERTDKKDDVVHVDVSSTIKTLNSNSVQPEISRPATTIVSIPTSTTTTTLPKTTTTSPTTPTTTTTSTTTSTTTTTTTTTSTTTTKEPEKTYSILFYTSFFGDRPWSFVSPDFFKNCECKVHSCKVSYDTNTFNDADVVIFHGRNMPNNGELDRLDRLRKKGQRWAYFIMENPGNASPVKPLDKYFNWTISYRLNSDFFFPYHEIKQMKTGISPDINYAQGKTKQIAWFVSHCGTGRDRLAKKMEDYGMKLEVGGGCAGNFRNRINCPRNVNCMNLLSQYKFYFAAENGFCKDYVTEKYYKQGLMGNTIPIVLGAAAYTNPKVGIPGSYINPLDFNSPKEFVDYLKMLDKNDTMYNEYFKWKLNWKQEDDPNGCKKFVCDICEKLHSNHIEKDRPLSVQFAGDCDAPSRNYEEWINRS